MTFYTYLESPLEPLTLVSDGTALTALQMVEWKHGPQVAADWVRDDAALPLAETKRQLTAYFHGELTEFEVPLALQGTEFQRRVWEELRRIPCGVTISYGELAARLGKANAARAVGSANGRNPISIIVPCHRVIGTSGKLTGYGGGLARKEWLLAHERKMRG